MRGEPVSAEPTPSLDLAYEGRLRRAQPSATLAEFRHLRAEIMLDSAKRMVRDLGGVGSEYRADAICEQINNALYELRELRAGR